MRLRTVVYLTGAIVFPGCTYMVADSLDNCRFEAEQTLPGHEAQVIRLRFGLHDEQPMGLAATAQRLGLSAELVRQIEIRALSRLARAAGRRELHDFLE